MLTRRYEVALSSIHVRALIVQLNYSLFSNEQKRRNSVANAPLPEPMMTKFRDILRRF